MRFSLLLLAFSLPLAASAQSDLDRLSGAPGFSSRPAETMQAPPESAAPDPGGAPTQVPVDGGLTLLALAGAGYAGKKLRDRRRA